ncbi:MAG: 30S ribosomal protein S20 [Nitrospinaceae bacterium]
MANHKSAIKRNRQNEKRYARNKGYRTRVKTVTKSVLEEVEEKNKENAERELKVAAKTISRVASKGVLHKRAAARKISNLSRLVHRLSTPA